MIIDVDHFKNYNDQQGHQGGDVALVAMGSVLKLHVRAYDFVARIGGEEFMVVMPNTSKKAGMILAERIRLETQNQAIANYDGTILPSITVSIGLAYSDATSTTKSLFSAADKQLYLAKQSGRNCVR